MLLNVAAHNRSIQNLKVSKRKSHITYSVTKCTTYSVTKRTASQNIQHHKTYSAQNVNVKKVNIMKHKQLQNLTSQYLKI
jgi:hypothetical protein